MELKDFIRFLNDNVTAEAFEAMALHFAKQQYDIIGCYFNISDNVKIYKLFRKYIGDECYLVINYYNKDLDSEKYPKDTYMIAGNDTDTLMCLCNYLFISDRVRARMPRCLKDICNVVFSFTKLPIKYFNYQCESIFFDHIVNKHVEAENIYSKNLGKLFQKCTNETLSMLKEKGLFANKKDYNKKYNTVTLTYDEGKTKKFSFYYEFDGLVTFTNTETRGSFSCFITDDTDIQKFKEKVLRFVGL